MASSNSFKSIGYHNSLLQSTTRRRRHSIDCPLSSAARASAGFSHSVFLKRTATAATTAAVPSLYRSKTPAITSSSATSSSAPKTSSPSPPSSENGVSFEVLEQHLSSRNYREADEETRRLLIVLAGDPAVKRGYVFFSEVQFIAAADLKTIDDLWRKHSDNRFGYSIQKRIWEKSSRDFTKFFIKVGWMKKLESSEIEQYNYRAFPNEFMWELNEETPEGHLPLTNALRGTQLLNSILTHPAFVEDETEEQEEFVQADEEKVGVRSSKALLGKRVFKTDYSF